MPSIFVLILVCWLRPFSSSQIPINFRPYFSMLGILLISNQFTDSFLGFFNFDEAYDTILTEQEQRTDPLMTYVIYFSKCYCFILACVEWIRVDVWIFAPKQTADYLLMSCFLWSPFHFYNVNFWYFVGTFKSLTLALYVSFHSPFHFYKVNFWYFCRFRNRNMSDSKTCPTCLFCVAQRSATFEFLDFPAKLRPGSGRE